MRDYAKEFENRVAFIRDLLKSSGAKGVIYGNSGGKDSALVGILCKAACDNTVGIMMPCASKRNFGEDMSDGLAVAEQFNIDFHCPHLPVPQRDFGNILINKLEIEPVLRIELIEEIRHHDAQPDGNVQYCAAPAHAHALHDRRGGGTPRRRDGQPQRGVHGLLHEVGRRCV